MIAQNNIVTDLETNINNSFKLYKNTIVFNFLNQIKQEHLKGESKIQYTNFAFYLSMYLITIIYDDVKNHLGKNWSYFYNKYNLENLIKCFACYGIDLNKILKEFNLTTEGFEIAYGIENIGIEKTFEVEPSNIPVIIIHPKVNLLDVLLSNNQCINNVVYTTLN